MGSKLSRVMRGFITRNERRLLLVGLDNAGKTTILMRMKAGTKADTIPTVSFNVETVKIGKLSLHIWDVGGQDRLRPYWRHYYTGTQGIVYVIDSSDRERLNMAATELKDASFLIFANKQDVAGATTPEELTKLLDLQTVLGTRPFHVQGCTAITGDGLAEGIEFLCGNMKRV